MGISHSMTESDEALRPKGRDAGARARSAGRPSKTEITRRRLLDAGLALFAEHGPRGVTSHAIATKAGYAAGTFYLHFKDKIELFRELAEDTATTLETRLIAASRDKSEPVDMMYAQADALVGFAEEQRDLLRIVFHPGGEAGDVAARILERLAEGVSARRRERATAGLTGDCFDSDVLAQAIVGMWAHVLAWWAEDPSRASRADLVRTLTHFQLHGHRSETGDLCSLDDSISSTRPPLITPPAGDSEK
jgi:AcrR family transcriptional regulator